MVADHVQKCIIAHEIAGAMDRMAITKRCSLLNEVQHQQQMLEAQAQQLVQLKAENERLQSELVKQNAALAARLQQLEAQAARMVVLAAQ